MAAYRAAQLGAQVFLLEKTERIGTKILISGGGKCNITHAGPIEEVLREFRPNEARFIRPACYRWTNEQAVAFLTDRGLRVYTRDNGRVFPVDQTAKDVVHILQSRLDEVGVETRLNTPVIGIERDEHVTGLWVPRSGHGSHHSSPLKRAKWQTGSSSSAPRDPRGRRIFVPQVRHHRRRLPVGHIARPHDRKSPRRARTDRADRNQVATVQRRRTQRLHSESTPERKGSEQVARRPAVHALRRLRPDRARHQPRGRRGVRERPGHSRGGRESRPHVRIAHRRPADVRREAPQAPRRHLPRRPAPVAPRRGNVARRRDRERDGVQQDSRARAATSSSSASRDGSWGS